MGSSKVIFTGGSGLLGTAMKKLRPEFLYPTHDEFDICSPVDIWNYVAQHPFDHIVNAAAFISPPKVEANPLKALEVNIIGTANVIQLCAAHKAKFTFISTDYVFGGEKGNYKETDPVNPVNKYAWSKLGGECAVRMYDKSLIVRITFGANAFPYEKAYIDHWTSREPVMIAAKKISDLLNRDITGVIHIGGSRKTAWEYAKSIDPTREIGKMSIKDVPFNVPVDTSLDCTRYNNL